MSIRAVFFDVGEVLVDETRLWTAWADWLKVPRGAFFAAFRSVIESGEHHQRVFEIFAPGFDLKRAQVERRLARIPDSIIEADLYPDALPCLKELRLAGYKGGIAGN